VYGTRDNHHLGCNDVHARFILLYIILLHILFINYKFRALVYYNRIRITVCSTNITDYHVKITDCLSE